MTSFCQSEKWTWQQMLVCLLEIKYLNNCQKRPFSLLDNKRTCFAKDSLTLVQMSKSIKWCSRTATATHEAGQENTTTDFLMCPSVWMPSPFSFCVNEQNPPLSEARAVIFTKPLTDLLLFQIICLCFDVKLISPQQPVYPKEWRDTSWPDQR